MAKSKGLEKVYLISISPAEEAGLVIKAATVRITHNVLRRSIDDLVTVELFPKTDLAKADFISGIRKIAQRCQDQVSLIAISVMTNDYHLLREVSATLREESPNTPIVAGGPHFVDTYKIRGKLITSDSTAAKALNGGVIDIVNIGEGSGLRELILGIKLGSLRFTRDQNGFTLECLQGDIPKGIRQRCSNGRIDGNGRGKMPHINYGNPYIIPIRYREGIGANFNLSNRCPNRCNYCNSPKHVYGLEIETYFYELDRIMPNEKVSILQANDNHPFERCNRKTLFQFLNTFQKNYKRHAILYNFFIDPSTLLEKDSSNVWRFLESLSVNTHQFQFGRECTNKDVALALGRHYHGTPRDQQRLDAEGCAIKKAAKVLPKSKFKVFYILTPFESELSILCTIRELESFSKCGNIYTGSNLLWPLPGTSNRGKYMGQYFSFEDVPEEVADKLELITQLELNFWHPSLPASDFLDYLTGTAVKMYVEPELPNNTSYHLTMMKIIASIAFGMYKPGETVPSLIGELSCNSEQKPGDIHPNFTEKILGLAEYVDKEELFDRSVRSKIRFSELVREKFWLWDKAKVRKLRLELECVYEFRSNYFGIENDFQSISCSQHIAQQVV